MAEEVLHAKPIFVLPERALVHGQLEALKQKFKRTRKDEAKKLIMVEIDRTREKLKTLGG